VEESHIEKRRILDVAQTGKDLIILVQEYLVLVLFVVETGDEDVDLTLGQIN